MPIDATAASPSQDDDARSTSAAASPPLFEPLSQDSRAKGSAARAVEALDAEAAALRAEVSSLRTQRDALVRGLEMLQARLGACCKAE